MSAAITINVGAGCGPILSHLYAFGQEFHAKKKKYPMRTAKSRRSPEVYAHQEFSRGTERWTAWAYHTTRGVVVGAVKHKEPEETGK